MDKEEDAGVFLTLNDCRALYPGLKGNESILSDEERMVLRKIEKVLYGSLSVQEIEELTMKNSSRPGAPGLLCKPGRV